MPILDVRIIGHRPRLGRRSLALRFADAAAKVFQSGPQNTWVTVEVLPRAAYAENEGGPPEGVSPVFVRVLKRELPAGARLKAEAKALAAAISGACGRPEENIHIFYEPAAKGRVAFGGKFRE